MSRASAVKRRTNARTVSRASTCSNLNAIMASFSGSIDGEWLARKIVVHFNIWVLAALSKVRLELTFKETNDPLQVHN